MRMVFLSCVILCLSACASKSPVELGQSGASGLLPLPMDEETGETYAEQMTDMCYAQLQNTIGETRPHRGVIWAKCKKNYVMPVEQKIYPERADEIAAMYDALIGDMTAWYEGRTTYSLLNRRWAFRQQSLGFERIETYQDTIKPL